MKNLEEFPAVVRMPDGEAVSIFLSVVNREIHIRTSEETEKFRYLRSIDSVMEQIHQILAERVGHVGGGTTLSPMGAGTASQGSAASTGAPVSSALALPPGEAHVVLHLEKGKRYAFIIYQQGVNRNINIAPAGPADTLQTFQAVNAPNGICVTDVVFVEGRGQTLICPLESVHLS